MWNTFSPPFFLYWKKFYNQCNPCVFLSCPLLLFFFSSSSDSFDIDTSRRIHWKEKKKNQTEQLFMNQHHQRTFLLSLFFIFHHHYFFFLKRRWKNEIRVIFVVSSVLVFFSCLKELSMMKRTKVEKMLSFCL